MDVTLQKLGALVIIAGSVLFLIAAFAPVSRVFVEPSAAKKLDIILGSRVQWTFAQGLFALGALVTAVGVGVLAVRFRLDPIAGRVALSSVALLVGAGLWTWHVYLRAVDPQMFANGLVPVWLFVTYTLLSMAGLALLGWAFLQTDLQPWVGWMLVGSMAAFFVLAVILGDMAPFVYYVVALIAAVVLFRAA
jgi:hypothetical protein